MEFCLPHLMSKDEVLRILKERQLNIPDIESLPYEELMRIYTTFAVPLAKRESTRPYCSNSREQPSVVQNIQNRLSPEERTMKRSHGMDINFCELYMQDSERAKRFKWTELPSAPSVAMKEIPQFISSNVGKKRKLVT